MTKTINLTFLDTQNHGYVEIAKHDFNSLGMNIRDFSQYSYHNQNCYYFEEDCDALKLHNFLKKQGCKINEDKKYVHYSHFNNLEFQRINTKQQGE